MPDALRPVGLIAAYLVLAKLGLLLAFVHGTVATLWPASGLAIAALTLWGLRLWPAVTVGAFLANYLFAHHPAAAAAGIAVGNTFEAVLAAALLHRLEVGGEVARIRDALAILAAAAVGPVPSAAAGVLSLGVAGILPGHDVLSAGLVWWLGDSMGILLVSPLLLAWFGTRSPAEHAARPAEFASAMIVTVALATLYYVAEMAEQTSFASLPPSAFLFPPVFWAILRLRPREAILVLVTGCTAAVTLTAAGMPADTIAPLLGIQIMVFTVGGGALAMLGAITERIGTQIQLRDSREQLAYAMAAGRSGTFDWNARTNQSQWSDELLALYGLRREQFGGRLEDWLTYLAPEHKAAARDAIDRALKTGDFNLDFQIRRRDNGEARWLSGRARVHFDAAGKPIRMIGVNMDITDRKAADMSLKASETQLKVIVEHAPVGIAYLTLPDRRFLWVNEAMCEITGYRHHELLEMSSLDLTMREDRHMGENEYAELAAGHLRNFVFEKRYVRKDGSIIWARSSVSGIDNESGKATFAINIIENVTASRLADAARRDAERRLQLAVDIAELGSWEFHVADDHAYIAPSWKKRLGLDDAETDTGEQWQSRVHPDDRQRLCEYLSGYLKRPEGPYQIEYRFRYGDGSYHWLSSRAVAVTDAAGQLQKLIGTHLDITDRKRAEQRIREESLHDPLTGLPNRGLILEYGAHLISATERSQGHCAVLFIDLDRFKPINDTYGHEAGDAVLKEVARRLRACTRREDLVGRLGGDEFVIVLPHVDYQHHRVDTVARHVLSVVGKPIPVESWNLSVSPSIGVSYFPDHGSDMEALIEKADVAMYRAKQQGRANCQTYTPDLERRNEEAAERKTEFQAALQRGALVLHYQPIVNLRTGRMVAAEALLRMIQEDGETMGPGGRMPKGESSELGAEMDQWVLTDACRQHEDWVRQGLAPILLSVNVSPLQFMQPVFAGKVRDIVSKAGIDPAQLQLEVSDKWIEGSGIATDAFQQLKSLGIRIALDGFGSGPLDLSQLTNLPIDCIKLEPMLIRRAGADPAAVANVSKLVIALGRMLDLEVVGEGIESEEMLQSLQQSGCNEAQGFYFCHPLPADDFARWYRKHQMH